MNKEYLRVFRAFTDENRLQILELLCAGEQCACVLLDSLKISQPTLSHHMKLLCQSGIVKSRRVGPWNYYSINKEGCEFASRLLSIVAKKKLNTTIELFSAFYRFLSRFRRHPVTSTAPSLESAESTEFMDSTDAITSCSCSCSEG